MIRKFEEKDIREAKDITFDIWNNELGEFSYEFKQFIYEYLVRYYLLNNGFSFVYDENGVKAFLLAANKKDHNEVDAWFNQCLSKLTSKEKKRALEYKEYLVSNGDSMKSLMGDDDLYVALFASTGSGKGKYLLNHLENICKSSSIRNLYLWTDNTCNYSYYDKKHFVKVKEFPSTFKVKDKLINTIIFKKDC